MAYKEENLDGTPEVKSFVYQQLVTFEPFVSKETTLQVFAKNPLHIANRLAEEGREIPKQQLKKMHRIVIVMTEGRGHLEAEGLNENIFEAIIEAKDKLYRTLLDIQNSAGNTQERINKIAMATKNLTFH